VPADIPEVRGPGEPPEAYVERLAREKALAVAALAVAALEASGLTVSEGVSRAGDAMPAPPQYILAGDTTVALGDAVFEKPENAADAVRMLMALSGRVHRVATGLALVRRRGAQVEIWSGVEVTRVRFRTFDRGEAERYVATGEPMGKAGAYAIQGHGGELVEAVEGDLSTVIGLSVPLLSRLFSKAEAPWMA
jgi:septum formation protein